MNWLDLKLGGRMLVKYPGLTVVGGLAMAFAIWVGIVTFQFVTLFVYPTLPLPGGDRIVEIRDLGRRGERSRGTGAAATSWSWRDTAAIGDGPRRLAGLEPQLDRRRRRRTSRPGGGDERVGFPHRRRRAAPRAASSSPPTSRPAASPVAVIGYDVWRTRFGSDPNVLGRTVQLGNEYVTVVGVMREGFAFPVSHDAVAAATREPASTRRRDRVRPFPSSACSLPAQRSKPRRRS